MQHDMVVDNGTGAVVLLDMNNVLKALASCSSGPVAPTTVYPGMFWLDTSVVGGFLRQRNRDNTDWAVVAGMPEKASTAEVEAGSSDTKYLTSLGVAQQQYATLGFARNRIVNPAMQVSQENGDGLLTGSGSYPADQWVSSFVGGAHSVGRATLATPRGSQKRLRWIVTTAKPALAASDFAILYQPIEGIRVADFLWGVPAARRVIVRFGFKGPAGTYSMSIRNGATNRTYIAAFTVSAGQANLDTEREFAVPGDASGTWAIDNSVGLYLHVVLACGSSLQGVAGWQAANLIGIAGQSNGMATIFNTFELFDVGLYLEPQVAPLNDAFTKVYLDMNGPDGSTVFVDRAAGGAAHTWTAFGNAQVDTADYAYGGASLLCDGTGDYITTPDAADLEMPNADWTIDTWFKVGPGLADGVQALMAGKTDAAVTVATFSWYIERSSSNRMRFVYGYSAGLSQQLASSANYTTTVNPGWHHFAVERSGTTITLYIDFIAQQSTTLNAALNNNTNNLSIGRAGEINAAMWNGWIDEFRISHVARGMAEFALVNGQLGVPPPWRIPDEPDEIRACQRYYCQAPAAWSNYCAAIATFYTISQLPVDMRGGVTPTFSTMPSNNSQSANFSAVPSYIWHAPRGVRVGRPSTVATITSNAFFFNTFAASARM